jgi:predicted membrane-bound spermidine synthase
MQYSFSGGFLLAFLLALGAIAGFMLFPWLLLWTLDTLGIGTITYGFWQWVAAFVVIVFVRAKIRPNNSDNSD